MTVRARSTPSPIAVRRVAIVAWAAMLVQLALFLGMVLALSSGPGVRFPFAPPPGLVFWGAAAVSVAGVVCSRLLPLRIVRQAGGRPETLGLVRLLVGWAVCDAVAICPLIGYLLVSDARLLALFAADAVALVTYFPSPNRWAQLGLVPESGGFPRR